MFINQIMFVTPAFNRDPALILNPVMQEMTATFDLTLEVKGRLPT